MSVAPGARHPVARRRWVRRTAATAAHVVLTDNAFHDGAAPRVLDTLQKCLGGHFDVEHSTFQLEPASHRGHEPAAHP